MRILLFVATLFTTLLHTVIPTRHRVLRRKFRRFYPEGYMREEVDALRQYETPRR
ncbi:MAG: hypothetical protein H6672_02710 [Anaerolineaceae bacterium]|nr:hypothetical protein [Anaerolineaceae bacterium]